MVRGLPCWNLRLVGLMALCHFLELEEGRFRSDVGGILYSESGEVLALLHTEAVGVPSLEMPKAMDVGRPPGKCWICWIFRW